MTAGEQNPQGRVGGWGEPARLGTRPRPLSAEPSPWTAAPRAPPGCQSWRPVARSHRALLPLAFSFLVAPVDGKPPQKVTSCRGGDGGGVLLSPVALPPPLESRLVNRLKPSRNVRDSEPEVGSASAGQTSFAGWRGRGRGSSCGGTSETPGCWERQGEGGGRGPRVGSRAARRREQPPPRAGGLGGLGVLSPRPGRAASARCASSSGELRPCAPCAGHQPGRVLPRAFPILLPSSLNQSPAGSPFLTCFPA